LAAGVEIAVNGIRSVDDIRLGAAAGAPKPAVTYAGGAPGLLCGVAQVNIVVPDDAPSGDFFLTPVATQGGRSQQGQLYVSIVVE